MKKFAGFTKEQVDAELKWVAIHGDGRRFVGTYAEVTDHADAFEGNKQDFVEGIELADIEEQSAGMVKFLQAWARINKQACYWVPYGALFDAFNIEEEAAM